MTTTLKLQLTDSSGDGCGKEHDEEKWLQHQLKSNIHAQEVLNDMHDLIVNLKGEEVFNYFFQTLITDCLHIENDLYEKFDTK